MHFLIASNKPFQLQTKEELPLQARQLPKTTVCKKLQKCMQDASSREQKVAAIAEALLCSTFWEFKTGEFCIRMSSELSLLFVLLVSAESYDYFHLWFYFPSSNISEKLRLQYSKSKMSRNLVPVLSEIPKRGRSKRGRMQKHNERKRRRAEGCKRAQMRAKERLHTKNANNQVWGLPILVIFCWPLLYANHYLELVSTCAACRRISTSSGKS